MSNPAQDALDDLRAAVQLLSRFPVSPKHSGVGLQRRSPDALRFAPVVGLVIGFLQASVMAIFLALRLPALAVAALGLAVSLCITGALHEDGLADVADGFGGGATPERKLAIMRDSRIGTFGAAALGCSLLLRAACLAVLAGRGLGVVFASLLVTASLSRSLMLFPVALLPPARSDGLGYSVTEGARASLVWSLGLAIPLAVAVAVEASIPLSRMVTVFVTAAAASLAMSGLARRQIGGMTGDVAGATQQVAEIAALLVLSAG